MVVSKPDLWRPVNADNVCPFSLVVVKRFHDAVDVRTELASYVSAL